MTELQQLIKFFGLKKTKAKPKSIIKEGKTLKDIQAMNKAWKQK